MSRLLRTSRTDQTVLPRSALAPRDLFAESLAGTLQRPGRTVLTMLGTVVGVGAFVAVLGLTATTAGQISAAFTVQKATTISVTDIGAESTDATDSADAPMSFPLDADARVQRLNGVVKAGVWWQEPSSTIIAANPADTAGTAGEGLTVFAATPGATQAAQVHVTAGANITSFDEDRHQPVAIVSSAAADRLDVNRIDAQPAIFIDNQPFTIIGIYEQAPRLPQMLLGVVIPSSTALADFGNPNPDDNAAQMLIRTRVGAAQLIAHQAPLALRPDDPAAFRVLAPPDPHSLQNHVASDVSELFLVLAGVCLVVGAVGIANTTLVAVLERTSEIGLRRSLGARPRHITVQFLTESTAIGSLGGLIGTSVGVIAVLAVAADRHWNAILDPATTLPAPLIGSLVGLLAGLYPSLRAARIDPITALRHDQ